MMLLMFRVSIILFLFSQNLNAQTVITNTSRLQWTQTAISLSAAQAYIYIVYVDNSTRHSLVDVICSGAISPFSCNSKFPPFSTSGIHSLQLAAIDVAESAKSNIFQIQVVAPITPGNIGVISEGTNWYVNLLSGNNSNSCLSINTPCLTLAGIQGKTLISGDTVWITGTTSANIVITKGGVFGQPITYRGDSGICPISFHPQSGDSRIVAAQSIGLGINRPSPITKTGTWRIRTSYVTVNCFYISNQLGGLDPHFYADEANINGITLTNSFIQPLMDGTCRFGISMDGFNLGDGMVSNWTIKNNVIRRCGIGIVLVINGALLEDNEIAQGYSIAGNDLDYMRVWGQDITIEKNLMWGHLMADCVPNHDCHIDCMQNFSTGGLGQIFKNIIWNRNICFNAGAGFQMDFNAGGVGNANNILVTNSIFSRHATDILNYQSDDHPSWGMNLHSVFNISVHNNTFAYSGAIGFRNDIVSSTGSFNCNIVHSSDFGVMEISGPIIVSGNVVYDSGQIYNYPSLKDNLFNVDPQLININNNNFKLKNNSPAIGECNIVGISKDSGAYPFIQ